MQTNAIGMSYGALLMAAFLIISGEEWNFEMTPGYIGSLLYLAVFGSVIAFGTYLTLLGRIGAARAAYVTVVFPIVALLLSVLYEGFHIGWIRLFGIGLVVAGNVLALVRRSNANL